MQSHHAAMAPPMRRCFDLRSPRCSPIATLRHFASGGNTADGSLSWPQIADAVARLRVSQSAERPVDAAEPAALLVRSPYRVCPLGAHIDHQARPELYFWRTPLYGLTMDRQWAEM